MAEAIGVASGLAALSTLAFQSSITLLKTIQSYNNYDRTVRDLKEEAVALVGVLGPLTELIRGGATVDLSALDLPLLRCATACKDYSSAIEKCSSRSERGRKSVRDWAKLKYMGDDIDGFRRLIADYKSTIIVALTYANLRASALNAESVKSYKELVENTTADLEKRLEVTDEKLETILGHATTASASDLQDLRVIREERKSTRKCLQICAQLTQHISQIQVTPGSNLNDPTYPDRGTAPEILTNEALRDCQGKLIATSKQLEGHMTDLVNRIVEKSIAGAPEETATDLRRLKDEWGATLQGLHICSAAGLRLGDTASTIDNYALGDAVQFLVSNGDKTIHGTNRGLGWRTRQVGGHLSDISIQQISRDFAGVRIYKTSEETEADVDVTKDLDPQSSANPKFHERHGPGVQLASQHKDGFASYKAK